MSPFDYRKTESLVWRLAYAALVIAAGLLALWMALTLATSCAGYKLAISTDSHRQALDGAIVSNAAVVEALEVSGDKPAALALARDVGATLDLLAAGLVGGLPVERRKALDPLIAATVRTELADVPLPPQFMGVPQEEVDRRIRALEKERDDARATAAAKDKMIATMTAGMARFGGKAVKVVAALGDGGTGTLAGTILMTLGGLAWKYRREVAAGLAKTAMVQAVKTKAKAKGVSIDMEEVIEENAAGYEHEVARDYERLTGKKPRAPVGGRIARTYRAAREIVRKVPKIKLPLRKKRVDR